MYCYAGTGSLSSVNKIVHPKSFLKSMFVCLFVLFAWMVGWLVGGCTVMRAQAPLGLDLHKSLQQPGIAGAGRGERIIHKAGESFLLFAEVEKTCRGRKAIIAISRPAGASEKYSH